MVPILYDVILQLLRDVSNFIKSGVLEKCKNASSLWDIDFKDAKNKCKITFFKHCVSNIV